jgi:hypothetical protein
MTTRLRTPEQIGEEIAGRGHLTDPGVETISGIHASTRHVIRLAARLGAREARAEIAPLLAAVRDALEGVDPDNDDEWERALEARDVAIENLLDALDPQPTTEPEEAQQ